MLLENKQLKTLTYLSILLVLLAFLMVIFYAPVELNMGMVQKVFYFHVSAAWLGMLAFLVAAISGIIFLSKKNLLYDHIVVSSV